MSEIGEASTGEVWLPVVGWERSYEVSNLGRVRSIPRAVRRTDGRVQHLRDYRVLRAFAGGSGGYATVGLGDCPRDGTGVKMVHTLVLTAFVGPKPPGQEACHGDGNPMNAALSNLRWDTPSANGLDRVRHGRDSRANRTHCPRDHRLVAPNLSRAELRKTGRRTCEACAQARTTVRRAAERGLTCDFRETADRHYARIMGGASC